MPIVFCSFGVTVFCYESVWNDASSGKGDRENLAAEREILQNDIVRRITRRLSLLG